MNPDAVHALLDYHYWARDRMLDAVEPLSADQFTQAMGNSFASVRDTVVHIYSAEWVWCSRWRGESPVQMLTPGAFPDLATLRTAWAEHETILRGLAEGLDAAGVDRVIEFKTLAGQPSASVLWQMLLHLVNHSSYHRGQVTTMLRQLGAAPPRSTDLITFYRERDARSV
jgi:uncharacterized damage-inducible protein DinB